MRRTSFVIILSTPRIWARAMAQSTAQSTAPQNGRPGLKGLILGGPINGRGDGGVAALNDVIDAICDLLPRSLGDETSVREAVMEIKRVRAMPGSFVGVSCKRALLLYTLWQQPELKTHYLNNYPEEQEATKDLIDRVLPLVCPLFFEQNFQTPDSFVLLVKTIWLLWAREDVRIAESGSLGEDAGAIEGAHEGEDKPAELH